MLNQAVSSAVILFAIVNPGCMNGEQWGYVESQKHGY